MSRSLAVTVFLLAAGCVSVDPAAKADVDARIANLQTSSRTIAAPPAGPPSRLPLAPGQWVQYAMRLPNGQRKLLTEKIIGRRGGAFWYEMVDDTYQGRTVEQLLVAFGTDAAHPHVELLALRKRDPKGHVVRVKARDLALPLVTYDTYREKLAAFLFRWRPLPQEPAVVPAGRFEGCYHSRPEISGVVRSRDNY